MYLFVLEAEIGVFGLDIRRRVGEPEVLRLRILEIQKVALQETDLAERLLIDLNEFGARVSLQLYGLAGSLQSPEQ